MSTREQKKRETKKAILEAAITLFSRNGFGQTSIEQIARTAGIGKGTVYSYFQTKKDIIKGFCEYELEQIHEQLIRNSDTSEPIHRQMKTIYMMEFHHITRNREFGRLYMRESLFPEAHTGPDTEEIDNKYLQMLFPIFEKAQIRGELRTDLPLLHLVAHFYSLFLLILSAWYVGRITTEEVEPALEQLFLQAVEGLYPLQPLCDDHGKTL